MRAEGQRLVVMFEGRDAAGKGGSIKRVTEYLNARVARIVALPAPTERERTQWYFQRYVPHLPAAGEIVLFDRSWYNRAGVERVMGFCTDDEYHRFLHQCPTFERMLVEDGILLRKYWFSVSDEEQQARFHSRLDDPMRFWKLSPMDLKSITHWEDYSRAKDEMMIHTSIPEAPWYTVESDDKRAARLNMIDHLLTSIDYVDVGRPELKLPRRPKPTGYERPPRDLSTTCRTTRRRSRPERHRTAASTSGNSSGVQARDGRAERGERLGLVVVVGRDAVVGQRQQHERRGRRRGPSRRRGVRSAVGSPPSNRSLTSTSTVSRGPGDLAAAVAEGAADVGAAAELHAEQDVDGVGQQRRHVGDRGVEHDHRRAQRRAAGPARTRTARRARRCRPSTRSGRRR